MELKIQNHFVADGHERWLGAHAAIVREDVRMNIAGKNERAGCLGRIRIWFKAELSVMRGEKVGEKSLPEILW